MLKYDIVYESRENGETVRLDPKIRVTHMQENPGESDTDGTGEAGGGEEG